MKIIISRSVYIHMMQPIKKVEQLVDGMTMYAVVGYALISLVACSLLFSAWSLLPYTIGEQLVSLGVILVVTLVSTLICTRICKVPINYESSAITALIIFFLISPGYSWNTITVLALASGIAVASKYLIAWQRQHIINPAAAGIAALSVVGFYESTWWIGTPEFFIPLVIVGLLVVYKLRRFSMVGAFLAVGFLVFLFEEWRFGLDITITWSVYWLSYPALFLAFFMLTEPFTTPPTRRLQIAYGAVVGFLSSTALLQPWVAMSPELALIIGNVAFYPATLRRKLYLTLKETRQLAKDTYEYVFTKPAGMTFKAGQYLEWMLPHEKADTRGIRRYFTIASSPTESVVRVAMKHMPAGGSSYKAELLAMQPGAQIIASQRAGDFVLPKDPNQKIAAIAGGIGVTPFSSHIQYLADTKRQTDYVLYYCNNYHAEAAYTNDFSAAAAHIPLRVISVLAKEAVAGAEQGYVDADMIAQQTPDYLERMWYLSGPPGMVHAYEKLLRSMHIPSRQIIKDFFPGLA